MRFKTFHITPIITPNLYSEENYFVLLLVYFLLDFFALEAEEALLLFRLASST